MCSEFQLLELSFGAQLPYTLETACANLSGMLDIFPQQIYFTNGFWLWLALGQEHSLYCGCQSARITARVGGGEQGAAPRTRGGHPEKSRDHTGLPGPLLTSSPCFLSAGIVDTSCLYWPPSVAQSWPLQCTWAGGTFRLDLRGCRLPQVCQRSGTVSLPVAVARKPARKWVH